MVKKEVKICKYCDTKIVPKCKQIELITKDNEKILAKEYFHFTCWKKFYVESIESKIQQMQKKAMGNVREMIKQATGQ